MSSQEGRQSPPPETQSGPQLKDAPAQGQGIADASGKKEAMADQVAVCRVCDGWFSYQLLFVRLNLSKILTMNLRTSHRTLRDLWTIR
jgi:hypothetical protein